MACYRNCYRAKKNFINELIDAYMNGDPDDARRILEDETLNAFTRLQAFGVAEQAAGFMRDKFFAAETIGDTDADKELKWSYWSLFAKQEDTLRAAYLKALDFGKPITTFWITFPVQEGEDGGDFKIQVTDTGPQVVVHIFTPQPRRGTDPEQGRFNKKEESWIFGEPGPVERQVDGYNELQRDKGKPENFGTEACDFDGVICAQLWSNDPSLATPDDPPNA